MARFANQISLDAVSVSILALGSLFGLTWRFSLTGRTDLDLHHDRGRGRIYAFWHSHLLSMAFHFRNTGKIALVSESRDGRRAAAVAQRWGHAVIQGSSSHGGAAALRACARELRQGGNIVITPDGPRGPREIVKPGVSRIAHLSGAPVVPLRAVPSRAFRLHSWDGFMIPAPFARIAIHIGEPVTGNDAPAENPIDGLTALIQQSLTGAASWNS
jgi:lysophospholipid acyltransferase (LPLAT)-like uncharacterized protein